MNLPVKVAKVILYALILSILVTVATMLVIYINCRSLADSSFTNLTYIIMEYNGLVGDGLDQFSDEITDSGYSFSSTNKYQYLTIEASSSYISVIANGTNLMYENYGVAQRGDPIEVSMTAVISLPIIANGWVQDLYQDAMDEYSAEYDQYETELAAYNANPTGSPPVAPVPPAVTMDSNGRIYLNVYYTQSATVVGTKYYKRLTTT